MIEQAIVVSIPVAGLLSMFWYIATWKPRPASPLPSWKPSRFEHHWEPIWGFVGTSLLIIGLVFAGLVFLVLVAFGLFVLVEDPSPMLGITLLLTLILIKLYSK